MSKCTRSLSLILTLILSFSLFSVNAFAVEENENLIDSDLSNWVDVGESLSTFQTVDITSSGSNNIISVEANSKGVAIIYDLTEFLKIGENYQFSFTLPNTNSTGLESYSLKWYLANSIDGPVASESKELVTVTNSNKSDFLGKTITFEFTYTEGFKNTCLALYIWGNDGLAEFPSTNFYINDVSLTRVVTESEKKLDGILGWLQDIWDKLVSIGDGLTEVWTNITSSVAALGDRISSFFSDLGNKITTEFTNLTSDFSGYISSLGDRISNYFTNLSVNISGFFDNLLEGIKDFFRGFGNLILYFNWEGEYTNPFESSDSIIGGGSDGEDEEEQKPKGFYCEFDFSTLTDFGSSDPYFIYAELLDNNVLYIRGPLSRSNIYFNLPFSISKDEFKVLKTYCLEFTVSDFNISSNYSNYNYLEFYTPNSISYKISITGNGTYKQVFTLDSRSSDLYISLFSVAKNTTFCLSDFKVYEVVEGGSTSDTGSDEEGTTENVSVQSALDNILEYLSTVTTDIENVMDSITGSIKLFSDFCDEFPFIKALCIFVLALIIYSTVIGL